MNLLIAFGFGWVASSLYTKYWAKLKPAVGRALAVVFGRQSAPTNSPKNPPKSQVDQQFSVENQPENVVDQPDKNPAKMSPTIGTVLKNFGQFFAWCIRNWLPILCVICVVVIVGGMMRLADYFGWGKSRGELRRDAHRNEQTVEARGETALAGAEEGERFREDRRAIQDELERGNAALESVPRETSDLDFLIAWRNADSSLLDAGSPAG